MFDTTYRDKCSHSVQWIKHVFLLVSIPSIFPLGVAAPDDISTCPFLCRSMSLRCTDSTQALCTHPDHLLCRCCCCYCWLWYYWDLQVLRISDPLCVYCYNIVNVHKCKKDYSLLHYHPLHMCTLTNSHNITDIAKSASKNIPPK